MEASDLEVRVRYAETDQMGVAHHAAYLVWFEAGRTEFIRGRGRSYAQIEAGGCGCDQQSWRDRGSKQRQLLPIVHKGFNPIALNAVCQSHIADAALFSFGRISYTGRGTFQDQGAKIV